MYNNFFQNKHLKSCSLLNCSDQHCTYVQWTSEIWTMNAVRSLDFGAMSTVGIVACWIPDVQKRPNSRAFGFQQNSDFGCSVLRHSLILNFLIFCFRKFTFFPKFLLIPAPSAPVSLTTPIHWSNISANYIRPLITMFWISRWEFKFPVRPFSIQM